MTIDWLHFTPWASLTGGLLIGCAVAIFVLFNGRIAGISGIVGGAFHPRERDVAWRLAFIAGLVLAPVLYRGIASLPSISIDTAWPMLVLAGLLVGVGTRYGAGCTSGHGVCGISRLSPRSLAATACFMATGFATTFVIRHLMG